MDTLILPQYKKNVFLIPIAGLGLAISIFILSSTVIFAKDLGLGNYTGVSPTLSNIIEEQNLKELNFNESVGNKYAGATISEVEKGIKHIRTIRYYGGRPVRINVVELSTDVNPLIEIEPSIASDILVGRSKISKIAQYKDGNLSNGEADFPFLGANIFKKGTTTRPSWIDAYTVVEYGDVKVGIIGIIGGTQESSILTDYVQDYDFLDDPSSLVKKYAKELRTEKGCDVVVVASHDHDETLNSKLANFNNDEEIDAIFCAHTHYYVSDSITRYDGISIPVVQNRHKNNTVAEVLINVGSDRLMYSYETQHYYISESYEMSSDLDSLINEYNDLIVESNRVLGKTSSTLYKSLLGEYATKAMLDYNYNSNGYDNIDLAIINTGGVRSTISSGEIKVSDVFNSFPFNNKVILVTIKGSYINTILSQSGLYYTKGVSSFDASSYYRVAVIDYVYTKSFWQNKGFKYSTEIVETDYIMRDLLVDYIDKLY